MNNQKNGPAGVPNANGLPNAPAIDPTVLSQRISKFVQQNEDFKNLLRPEHMTTSNLSNLPGFDQNLIESYHSGVTKLWATLLQMNPADPQFKEGKARLGHISNKVTTAVRAKKADDAKKKEQAGQTTTQSQGQAPLVNQQGSQNSPKVGQEQLKPPDSLPVSMLSEVTDTQLQKDVGLAADKIRWNVPSSLDPKSDEAKQWIATIKERWIKSQVDKQRQKHNMTIVNMEFGKHKNKEDKDVIQHFERQRAQIKARYDAAEAALLNWNKHISSGPPQTNASNNQMPNGNAATGPNIQNGRPVPNASTQPQMPRQQPAQAVNQQTSANPNFSQRPQPLPMQTQNQRPPTQQGQSNTPVALTHQEALARSHNSSQQPPMANGANYQDPRQQPTLPDGDPKRVSGQPISKTWQPPPPQPVNMGAARPTLAGANNGPVGPMGQPAIQKPETFLLQGPGDRVLEKRKLDELYRQVCGADAGEGDALNPEVSESMLQLGDEFVDNVVTNACKLAKLRGGTTLEIRDIQLVLERQYNIRIPGFATDEVRTVRKTQPAAGYYHKMSHVQAAKVMGGKTDT